MPTVPGAKCYAYYDDDDRGYSCELNFGHEPPHQEIRDYRIGADRGFMQTTVWWDDVAYRPSEAKPKDCESVYHFPHGEEHCVREYGHPGVHLNRRPTPVTGLLPLDTFQWLA